MVAHHQDVAVSEDRGLAFALGRSQGAAVAILVVSDLAVRAQRVDGVLPDPFGWVQGAEALCVYRVAEDFDRKNPKIRAA